MDPRLAELYGTNQEDVETLAADELAEKLASAEETDLNDLDEEAIEALAREVLESASEEEVVEEKTAASEEAEEEQAEEPSAVDVLANQRALEILRENGIELEETEEPEAEKTSAADPQEVLAQTVEARAWDLLKANGYVEEETVAEEKPEEEKVAEAQADYLGRVMAHSFTQELRGIEKEANAGGAMAMKAMQNAKKGGKVMGKLKEFGSAAKQKANDFGNKARTKAHEFKGKAKSKVTKGGMLAREHRGKLMGAGGAAAGVGAGKKLFGKKDDK